MQNLTEADEDKIRAAKKEPVSRNEEKEKQGIANKEPEAFSNSLEHASQYARSLIEASLDPLVTISPEGKITDVNEASVKVTGVLREKLIGTDFSGYFTEPEKAREGYKKVFEKEFVSDYPLTIRHKNGKLTEVLYNASVYKDSKGNVLGVFAAARDVTILKQASRYARSLLEASLDPLVTISPEGKITDVNEASVKVTGVSREKLIGTDFSDYFTEPEKAREGYKKVFEKEFVSDYPLTICHKNGKLTEVLYNASVYKDDNGNVLGVFAAARDVTAQKAEEFSIANKELVFQNNEKEKRAAELSIANKELVFQNEEKEKRAAELSIANKELLFQNDEKEKRAAELIIANKELAFQNVEKEKRAAELIIANKELAIQSELKEKRAAELGIANKELLFQNEEKEKRAAELIIANKELAFQNEEKEKRAAELGIANKELAFQNEEKEKRAAELGIANKELAFQNEEKEKRAAELGIANKELAFQNEEKEKRAAELIIANKELLAFTYISSHDLQEPLRKIQTFVTIILESDGKNLSDKGKYNFKRMQLAARRMQQLIDDLLAFSRISTTDHKFENTDLTIIIEEVKNDLRDTIQEKKATIEVGEICPVNIIAFQFRQLLYNLISNALKFSNPKIPSHIIINSSILKGSTINNTRQPSIPASDKKDQTVQEIFSAEKNYCHISIKDNGIGFEPHFSERIFGVFQKLHSKEVYEGTGIGLAIVKKIVENHKGFITATGELNKGSTFDIYLPVD